MTEADRITEHTHDEAHVAEGLALLTHQYRGKAAITAILTSWLTEAQELEDAFWQLLTECGIASGEGAQLDQIGELLGQPRVDLSDANYRTVLAATALAIRSSGTAPELVAIVEILRGAVDTVLTEHQVATVKVEPETVLVLKASLVLQVLARAKAAGVRLLVVDPPSGDAFTFAEGALTVVDEDLGLSDTGGLVGGALVGILEA